MPAPARRSPAQISAAQPKLVLDSVFLRVPATELSALRALWAARSAGGPGAGAGVAGASSVPAWLAPGADPATRMLLAHHLANSVLFSSNAQNLTFSRIAWCGWQGANVTIGSWQPQDVWYPDAVGRPNVTDVKVTIPRLVGAAGPPAGAPSPPAPTKRSPPPHRPPPPRQKPRAATPPQPQPQPQKLRRPPPRPTPRANKAPPPQRRPPPHK